MGGLSRDIINASSRQLKLETKVSIIFFYLIFVIQRQKDILSEDKTISNRRRLTYIYMHK